ncbi:MAG: CoA transferase, partial [Streptosporangiales bacterium]|nr:CoA transferase [Streptosporangiales bacterium]
ADAADAAPVAPFFLTNNRGKKSVTLDLRTRQGHEQALALVETADVFLEAFRPGVLQRLGLGPEQVRARNPRCVYASLTAYGDGGPNGRRPGVDLMVQAESGALTGLRDGDGSPLPIAFQFIDGASGHVLAQSVLAALLQRERHGVPEVIKVSLYDVACSLQSAHLTMMLNETPAPPRPRAEPPRPTAGMPLAASPSGIFAAADGHLVLAAYVPKHWEILCAVLDRGDLAEDPRFTDAAARSRNNAALAEELSATFATRPAAEWVARLQDAGLMACRVLHWREVVTSDLFGESRVAARAGDATVIRTPARYSTFEPAATDPPPALGEHNDELLRDGHRRAEVAR